MPKYDKQFTWDGEQMVFKAKMLHIQFKNMVTMASYFVSTSKI